ncbi:MAG: PAS domain S-box protein [Methanomicrobiales archaeon]|nr:PAS domain S-box protein [Methanomicrobiales archaeon]
MSPPVADDSGGMAAAGLEELLHRFSRHHEGIAIMDRDGTVLWINRLFREMAGAKGMRIRGRPLASVLDTLFWPAGPTGATGADIPGTNTRLSLRADSRQTFAVHEIGVELAQDYRIIGISPWKRPDGEDAFHHLAVFAETAAIIADVSDTADIFRHIGNALALLCPGSLVVLLSADAGPQALRVAWIEGTARQKKSITRLFTPARPGWCLPLCEDVRFRLQEGRLHAIGGMEDLCGVTVPRPFAERIEEEIGVKSGYCAGFAWKGTLYGAALVFSPRPASAIEIRVAEALISQASVALQRWHSEDALARSQEQYRELVNNANSIIIKIDKNANITFFNEFAQQFFGYSGEEILGRSVFTTIVPEFDSEGHNLHDSLSDIFEHHERYLETENENITRDGRRVWISWRNRVIRGKDGTLQGLLCVGNDITEQKQALSLLRQSEVRYRTLFESARDGFLVVRDYRIIDCNHRSEELFGMGREGLLGKKPFTLGPPLQPGGEVSDDCGRRYIRAALAGRPQLFEWRHRKGDGTLFDAEISLSRMDISGEQTLTAVVRDITDRKMAENALKESELRYRSTIDSMADPVHVIDRTFRILLVNNAFCDWFRSFGFTTDIIGNHLFKALPVLSTSVLEEYRRVFREGVMIVSEETIRTGEIESISETRKIPVFEEDEVVRVVTVVRDITAQRKIEILKRQAFEQIEKNLEQFAILNDHIRNPLQTIVGLADLEGGPMAEKIFVQAKEIDAIIKRLDIGWLESEKIRQFLHKHYGV